MVNRELFDLNISEFKYEVITDTTISIRKML